MSCQRFLVLCLGLAVFLTEAASLPSTAQSLTSGDITGVVTDPSGAVIPKATVTLKNQQTGATKTTATDADGAYRFALLPPGSYTVQGTAQNFQGTTQTANVSVGQATTLNLQLALASASTTVEVVGGGGVVQAQNANISTTMSPEQVADVPNPGNDLSYLVQTAPGAVMNTQAGYGNSSTYGISATSNLFTTNGMNENDPFLNLNNSGATNLMLGKNNVQEATVVNNGYSGQYGGMAGANVNYVTKSGTNNWHGNAQYFWNGRTLNANNFFNNRSDTPRGFVNANQWAASVGGPIRKDKTFLFVDNEGLYLAIPTSTQVLIPSPAFQTATLTNLAGSPTTAGEAPFYNRIFSIFNNAPGASRATPLAGGDSGCGTGFSLPGGANCALQFQSNAGNHTHEWLLTARVDQNLGENDHAFVHFRADRGVQATYTDPLNPVLNVQSTQPQYEGQFQENHNFGANAVNQLILAGSWYSAIFAPANITAATQLLPFEMNFNNQFYTMGGPFYRTWPQGRNVTQYQGIDDYSWMHGRNSFKFGVNFRRNDVTDYSPGGRYATIPMARFSSLRSFFNGTASSFTQAFTTRPTQPEALYTLGLYAQDEFSMTRNLKLTLALRAEHNSNPVCQTDCFARLTDSFLSIPHLASQPYSQVIATGQHQALPDLQSIVWEPRLGFAWQPFGSDLVFRGGFGIFADSFPATVASSFATNSPLKNTFIARNGLIAPGAPNGLQAQAISSNAAFSTGFRSGLTLAQLMATNPLFTPPNFYNAASTISVPRYQEWNLEVQKGLGKKTSLSLNYVGNHGIHEPVQNAGLNAFCDVTCLGTIGTTATSFAGLPAAAPDPRFGTITEVGSYANSNYNGLTVSVQRRLSQLQLQASYTWSHALDEVSNSGFLPFTFDTNVSVLTPQDPHNLHAFNYGNADYDVRHSFNLNYVWNTPWNRGWMGLLGGWTVAGTVFVRSGLPFTVVDSGTFAALNGSNFGDNAAGSPIFANYLGGAPSSCGRGAVDTPCFTTANFSPAGGPSTAGFGLQRRNQFYGPRFFNTDLSIMKNFPFPHWESAKLSIGAQAVNLFNHPNFDQPNADLGNVGQLGLTTTTVNTPTSIFGSFLGADASPRALQLRANLTF